VRVDEFIHFLLIQPPRVRRVSDAETFLPYIKVALNLLIFLISAVFHYIYLYWRVFYGLLRRDECGHTNTNTSAGDIRKFPPAVRAP